jgi:hypothetical protein
VRQTEREREEESIKTLLTRQWSLLQRERERERESKEVASHSKCELVFEKDTKTIGSRQTSIKYERRSQS